jgi:tetratricopeptide (TPR) repeat protein
MTGLAGAILAGCASPARHTTSPPAVWTAGDDAAADSLGDLVSDATPDNIGRGNPDALAHYAAGLSYEWNDDDASAVEQFNDAAIADPSNEYLAIKVAQRFLRDGQTDKAIAVLSKSARRPDASGMLLSWLARADLQAGKTNQALEASRLSIKYAPGEFEGYECQIEILFRKSETKEAVRTMARAARSMRPDPASLMALGELYATYFKLYPKDTATQADGIALLDRVSKMNFPSPHMWQNLADLYVRLDRPQRAAAIYTTLLQSIPDPSPARASLHEKLAAIYFQEEDKTNATKQLEAIVRDDPTRYPRAWFFLGELAFDDNKLGEASDDYENAIHWDPGFDEAYYKLALVQIELHRTEDAFKTLEIAGARFPKTFLCEFYTGIAYLNMKNFPEAIRHFDAAEVIALASADTNVLDYRFYFQFGEACERSQQYQRADQYLQKCIDLSPDFGEALNYLGYMLADRGEQLPRARTLIEKAVQLEPKNGAYLDSLGWVLFKEKLPQQALPWLLKAMQLSPEPDATVLDHLGEVYMALHQPSKAIQAWKQSLSIESNPDVKKKLDSVPGGA